MPVMVAKTLPSGDSGDPLFWGTSGSNLPILLDLVAPLGSSGRLVCEFFQAGDQLAARLPGGGELVSDVSFSDRTFQRLEVLVPMPDVERETTVVVLLSLKSKADGKVQTSTKVSVRLVPGIESPLNPVNQLRKLPEGSLLVTGESPRIRAYFDKMKISYVDGLELSSGISSLVLCEGSQEPLNIPEGVPVLLFEKSDGLMPGIYADPKNISGPVKVTLPILGSISSDVLAQKTFTELIFSALPKSPKNEP